MHTADGRAERIRTLAAGATHYQDQGRIAFIEARGETSFTVQLNWGRAPERVNYADVPDTALFYTKEDMQDLRG